MGRRALRRWCRVRRLECGAQSRKDAKGRPSVGERAARSSPAGQGVGLWSGFGFGERPAATTQTRTTGAGIQTDDHGDTEDARRKHGESVMSSDN